MSASGMFQPQIPPPTFTPPVATNLIVTYDICNYAKWWKGAFFRLGVPSVRPARPTCLACLCRRIKFVRSRATLAAGVCDWRFPFTYRIIWPSIARFILPNPPTRVAWRDSEGSTYTDDPPIHRLSKKNSDRQRRLQLADPPRSIVRDP